MPQLFASGTNRGRVHVYEDMKRVLAALVGIVVLSGTAAHADDHRAPKALLRVGGETQRGQRYHADWIRPARQDGFCFASFAHGFPTPPKAVGHDPGEPVVVRLRKPAMPVEVEVHRWPRVNEDGYASGTATPLAWSLRPHRVGGEVRAWDVIVAWPATIDHLYLGVGAYWRDQEGCAGEPDLGSQYAAWTFHLKAPSG